MAGTLAADRTELDRRPNIVVILTDDQTVDSLPHHPAVMRYLQGRIMDTSDHWVRFSNAFVNTPLCCPSRATVLTGLYSHRTGVTSNADGRLFDDSSTIATWLHDSGYRTGLFGKYLNLYPFGRDPFVPPGWDDWAGKMNTSLHTTYNDYTLIEDSRPVAYGADPEDYATDVLAGMAVDFVRTSPADRPFFLMFAPSAPHPPWVPAARHEGAFGNLSVEPPPSTGESDVSDKPAWVQALPAFSSVRLDRLTEERRREYETLLAVDDAVRSIESALVDRGALGNTVIFYLSDNGFSFGEHRWITKGCPYDECIRTPFLVRYPGADAREDDRPVSTVDLAPTIAEIAAVAPGFDLDGSSLVPLLRGEAAVPWRRGVLIEFAGNDVIPSWWGVRTSDFAYVELGTGERELYDLAGVAGAPDPYQLENRAADAAYAEIRDRLAGILARLRGG